MKRNNSFFYALVVLVIAALVFYFKNQQPEKLPNDPSVNQRQTNRQTTNDINQLTAENVVVNYLKEHHQLPDYYITKGEARKKGWEASSGNLCNVLPGRAIGGDFFSNSEGNLPKSSGRKWFEADLNYNCGRRNADRVAFSNDNLIFVTHDHYKSFQQK